MESVLEAKEGKRDLSVGCNEYCHKKNELATKAFPKIVPLYDGHELHINQKLIMNGLATISIRNMRSKTCPIKKRNSFFNLHRPELKGLNIVPTENQQGKMLQQHILKEVKTIHEIKSMRTLCKIDGPQSLSGNGQANKLKNDIKSEAELSTDNNFTKSLKPIALNQQQNDTDLRTSTLPTDKSYDEEIKSILIIE